MMEGGYVKLWRKIVDSEVMQDDWILRLFIWCLVSAKWRDGKDIKRGQFDAGRNQAADQLRVSPSKWYRGIQRLVELGCITIEVNSNRTRITVCNYSAYNDASDESEQRADSKRTASEQQTNTPPYREEGKKERREEAAPKNSVFATDSSVAQNAANDGPHSPEWLGREWLFYRRGTKGRDELKDATETFAEMLRLGIPGQAILDEIRSKGRKRTEPIWDFENRMTQKHGKTNAKHVDPYAGFRAVADEIARAEERGA